MRFGRYDWRAIAARLFAALAAAVLIAFAVDTADAQRRTGPSRPQPSVERRPAPADVQPAPAPGQADPRPPERVEADVTTRSIAITSAYTGTRIVVFGTVINSRQTSAEAGYYDVVVILEGTPGQVVARRKRRIWGIWRNADAITFDGVPGFYAIVSTRPLDDIAESTVLLASRIGFQYVHMQPAPGWEESVTPAELDQFKASITRLKGDKGLYLDSPYGVSFIGSSLFRASVDLPTNVPVGPLTARIHLFRDGRLLDTYRSRVVLEREGVERALHGFALNYSLLYGIITVLTAIGAGLAATTVFRRGGH